MILALKSDVIIVRLLVRARILIDHRLEPIDHRLRLHSCLVFESNQNDWEAVEVRVGLVPNLGLTRCPSRSSGNLEPYESID